MIEANPLAWGPMRRHHALRNIAYGNLGIADAVFDLRVIAAATGRSAELPDCFT